MIPFDVLITPAEGDFNARHRLCQSDVIAEAEHMT